MAVYRAFQFPAHPVDARTKAMWEAPNDNELRRYYGYKELIVCPTCQLLLADVAELRNEHRNAGGFSVTKKELFDQCKFFFFCSVFFSLLNILQLLFSVQRCDQVHNNWLVEAASDSKIGYTFP